MTKEALVIALKNAIERNEDFEAAKLSLINAGYPQTEIDTAMGEISSQQIQITRKKEVVNIGFAPPPPEEKVKKKKSVPFWIFLLGAIFVALIALGVTYFLMMTK